MSETQAYTLTLLAKAGTKAHYQRYAGRFNPTAYWFDALTHQRTRESTMNVLISDGLVDVTRDRLGYVDTATINETGRARIFKIEAVKS